MTVSGGNHLLLASKIIAEIGGEHRRCEDKEITGRAAAGSGDKTGLLSRRPANPAISTEIA